jgi:hypothetical protein
VSYSHKDEAVLDRLRVNIATLEREGEIETWDDREIRVGDQIDATILGAHDTSTVFMPIVSPDFLASKYCYEKEMQAALEKASAGQMTIFPIIAEPCDWLASPLRQFKAAPKNGKPISEWTNANVAYLDIVQELRRIAKLPKGSVAGPERSVQPSSSRSRVRIRRDFSSIDKGQFRDEAFREIRRYFQASIAEFNQIDGLQGQYEEMDANAFTCTIVNRAKRQAEGHLTVRNNKGGRSMLGDLTCSFEAYAPSNTANEIIQVEADEYDLFLSLGMRGLRSGDVGDRLSAVQVADLLWRDFVRRAGIDYE